MISSSRRRSARRAGTALAVAGLAVAGTGLALGPVGGNASSHREAPLTAGNPLSDSTDMYMFVSPDKPDTVTLSANWIPFQEPSGGPNFYPFGAGGYRYNIKVDNNGDAKPDITYRWTFTNVDMRQDTFLYNNGAVNSFDDPTLLFKQNYKLEKVDGAGMATTLVESGKTAPSYVGNASMPNYAALRDEAVTSLPGGGSTFAGQADDSFFLDLRVFDLLYGGDLSEVGNDTLTNYNVNTLSVQVPIAELTQGGDGSGIIGSWQTTDQQTLTISPGKAEPTGDFVQVSRLSAPLVNELVLPIALKDTFNSVPPEMDASLQPVVDRVTDPEVPKLIEKIYKIPAPPAPREDLMSVFLTGIADVNKPPTVQPAEMLRLNTAIPPSANPSRLGVLGMDKAGFPNGRRLADDVVDIEIQALEGAIKTGIVQPLAAGDGVDTNDKDFGSTFPYVALPESGSSTDARATRSGGGVSSNSGSGATGSGATGSSGSGSSGTGSGGSAGSAPTGGVSTGFGGAAGEQLPALPVSIALLGIALTGGGLLVRKRATN